MIRERRGVPSAEVIEATDRRRSFVAVVRNHAIKLGTADEIRLEMARVYRDMKSGKIETQTGTRLVYVLGELRKAHETTVIERRMQALEGPRHEPAEAP